MAPSAGAKFCELWLPPIASISALKCSKSVAPPAIASPPSPSMHSSARRAVCRLHEQHASKESKTWRGTHVRPNAFNKCEQLDQPKWLRFLPADANDLWREDFLEPAPKASNASRRKWCIASARKLRQVKCANIEQSRQLLFDIHDTVSQQKRVLAPRSHRRGGERQWRMPDVRHCQLYKEAHIHARIGRSHLFSHPCTQQNNAFAMTQHFSRSGHTPFGLCVLKGAEMT